MEQIFVMDGNKTITSAKTSINKNKIPAIFKKIHWMPYNINLDYGGGKYNTASDYLFDHYRILNFILDPYNRSMEENLNNNNYIQMFGGTDTATCANVLNVIQSEFTRKAVILNIYNLLKHNGEAYFSVYEGDKSSIGRQTGKDQWQENKRLSFYYTEIFMILRDAGCNFGIQQHKGMVYICKKD